MRRGRGLDTWVNKWGNREVEMHLSVCLSSFICLCLRLCLSPCLCVYVAVSVNVSVSVPISVSTSVRETRWSKVESSGKPRPNMTPPKPKPPRKVKQDGVTKPGDYIKNTIAQHPQTLSKMSDPALEGVRAMILEVQSQLRETENNAEKYTRLNSVMGQIRHRKNKREAPKEKLDAQRKEVHNYEAQLTDLERDITRLADDQRRALLGSCRMRIRFRCRSTRGPSPLAGRPMATQPLCRRSPGGGRRRGEDQPNVRRKKCSTNWLQGCRRTLRRTRSRNAPGGAGGGRHRAQL